MTLEKISNLTELYKHVIELNKKHFPNSSLMPIPSGGELNNPKYMFVFINPTYRNISANPAWTGPRYPFIGTREVWRIFHRAGFLPNNLLEKIENFNPWPVELAQELEVFLKKDSWYLTNLVKWTGEDSSLPDQTKLAYFAHFF